MKRHGIALLALVSLVSAGPAQAATAPDRASQAIEIAMMIGQVQALAELCSPPASSYESALRDSTDALDKLYADAGLDPDEIKADIDEGRQEEAQRHDDISFPLDCDLFGRQVEAVTDHLARARNEQASPTASSGTQ